MRTFTLTHRLQATLSDAVSRHNDPSVFGLLEYEFVRHVFGEPWIAEDVYRVLNDPHNTVHIHLLDRLMSRREDASLFAGMNIKHNMDIYDKYMKCYNCKSLSVDILSETYVDINDTYPTTMRITCRFIVRCNACGSVSFSGFPAGTILNSGDITTVKTYPWGVAFVDRVFTKASSRDAANQLLAMIDSIKNGTLVSQ